MAPCGSFGLGLLVLLAGGRARGWGLWLLLGAALGLAFSARTGAQFDALTAAYGGRTVRLTATVEDVQEGYTRSTVRARLRVSEVNGEPAAFCCQCDGLPLSRAGEQGRGLVQPGGAGPGRPARPLRRRGGVLGRVRAPVPPAGPGAPASAPGRPGSRAASARRCARELEGDEAGALAAMIVGDRTRISSELNSAYRAAGLSHVLVVSGMHVTILCGVALPGMDRRKWLEQGRLLAARLPAGWAGNSTGGWGPVARMELAPPRPARGGFLPGMVWRERIACAVAGGAGGAADRHHRVHPVGAAGGGRRVCIGALGVWLMAPADPLTSLALGGLWMSAFNSYAVCDIGFELSFAAVAGTLAGAELVRRRAARHPARAEDAPRRSLPVRLAARAWDAFLGGRVHHPLRFGGHLPRLLVLRGLSTSPYALLSGVAVALAGPALDGAGHRRGPGRAGAGAGARLPGLRLGRGLSGAAAERPGPGWWRAGRGPSWPSTPATPPWSAWA